VVLREGNYPITAIHLRHVYVMETEAIAATEASLRRCLGTRKAECSTVVPEAAEPDAGQSSMRSGKDISADGFIVRGPEVPLPDEIRGMSCRDGRSRLPAIRRARQGSEKGAEKALSDEQ
jgi:hypothetical protein